MSLTLADRVEHPEEGRGIDADSGHPLPIPYVLRDVGVDQVTSEVALTETPVEEQVLDQERGHNQPHTIVDPTLGAELTHSGIDEGESGAALAPGLQVGGIIAPCETSNLRAHRLGG